MLLTEGAEYAGYRVHRLLGRGGTGEVWEVRHHRLGIRRALKVPLSRSMHAQLLQEARVLIGLSHPNLMPVYRVLDIDGTPGVLMHLIEGPPLSTLFEHHTPTRAESFALLRAVCAGVGAAHAAGLVHRDLKPSNVLLEVSSGGVVPRVSDFGLARWHSAEGLTEDSALGTPEYMAPEQLRQAETDARADLWSLGVMLYELLTGTLPFPTTSLPDLINAHHQPLDLSGISPETAALLRELLQPDPAARLPDCATLTARLDVCSPDTAQTLGPHSGIAQTIAALEPPSTSQPSHQPLPLPDNAFLGRDSTLAELKRRFSGETRLVTVTGAGGVGKTRLTLEFAETTREQWPGGIWFCDLTAATSEGAILYELAKALDVPPGRGLSSRLGWAIESRGRALFVLDNFEQIVAFASSTVGQLLDKAPEACFLVTSRQPLGLRGEALMPLDTLEAPEAAALLSARAAAAGGVAFTNNTAQEIQEITELLDRLPLAIELVAAQARGRTPDQLLTILSGPAGLALAEDPSLPKRQRTLDATLQWSWALLTPSQRSVLSRCSVFAGGFTLEAAEAILSSGNNDESFWVEDTLLELMDQSLLRANEMPDGEARFQLLVSVRWFSKRQLDAAEHPAVSLAHARYYARFGALSWLTGLATQGGGGRMTLTLAETDNLIATLRSALVHDQSALIIPALRALSRVFLQTGDSAQAITSLSEARAATSLTEHERAALSHLEALHLQRLERHEDATSFLDSAQEIAEAHGDTKLLVDITLARVLRDLHYSDHATAQTHINRALAGAQQIGSRSRQASALWHLGELLRLDGQTEPAVEALLAAIALTREIGDQQKLASTLNSLGLLRKDCGEYAEALALFEESLALHRVSGATLNQGITLLNLGTIFVLLHQDAACEAANEEAYRLMRKTGFRTGEGVVLSGLGNLRMTRGRLQEASDYFERAVSAHRQVKNLRSESIVRLNQVSLYLRLGQPETARECLDAAHTIIDDLGLQMLMGYVMGFNAEIYRFQGRTREAIDCLHEAVEKSIHSPSYCAERTALLSTLYAEQDLEQEANAAASQSLTTVEGIEDLTQKGGLLCAVGRTRLLLGEYEEAAGLLEQATQIFMSTHQPYELAETLASRAELALKRGDLNSARALLREARSEMAATDCSPDSEVGRRLAKIATHEPSPTQ